MKVHDREFYINNTFETLSIFKSSFMNRVAIKMHLYKGFEEEYQKRHDILWLDLQQLLKGSGINEYSIFLDKNTNELFGFLKIEDSSKLDELPASPVMKKWWAYMQDIMECNPDNSPVSTTLNEVFYLPGIYGINY